MPANKKKRLEILIDNERNDLIENHLIKNNIPCLSMFESKYYDIFSYDQSDSNEISTLNIEHLKFIALKANSYWKPIAREMKIFNENQISEIERNTSLSTMSQKLSLVLQLWLKKELIKKSQGENFDLKINKNIVKLEDLTKILKACRLNKISEELLNHCD